MKEERIKRVLLIVGIVLTVSFCLLPFIYMVMVSFAKNADFLSLSSRYVFTVNNYKEVLFNANLHFLDYLKNSAIVSVVGAGVAVLLGSLAAFSITRLPLPFKGLVLFVTLSMSMFPQVSLVGFLFSFMTKLGWINTYLALIFPYIAWVLPLSLWILVSYFASIPRDIDKQAFIDGCSSWQILFKVIWPLARPGIFSTFLLAFIFSFNEFMFALLFTTDHRTRTVPVGIALFQGLHGEIPWGTIMAAATVSTLPIIVLVLVFQRNIIQGLTRGAVKG
ncbi:MAG TPA: carbohydrate ABC transporter permease [Candidatus Hydrothermia bacterium]|nr:carbohydrate ABC transporter permease [Candidatus Hydrothermia bacterium]